MADQLLINGRIHTMDIGCPRASALAVAGERILAVGDDPAALRPLLAPGAHVLDLGGRCVIPGLTDSHIHFAWYAQTLGLLDLAATATLDQLLDLVAQRARETSPGEWILGQGWDQERWPARRFPTAADLDRVAPAHPVMLRAKSDHALVANSPALHKAGITAQTPDPPGGRIGRDATVRPDGMLFEDSAMKLVADLIPSPGLEEAAGLLRQAVPNAWRVGLTGIHDMDGSSAFAAYQYLHAQGQLGLRVVKYLPADALDCALEIGLRAGLGDDWLRVGGLKAFADGALVPRTAAMLAPYEGQPDNLGILTTDEQALHTLVHKAAAGGLALAIHAIGDRANRLVLDALSPPFLPLPPLLPFLPSPPLPSATASSTSNSSTPPTCPAWPHWAWWPPCSRSTPRRTARWPTATGGSAVPPPTPGAASCRLARCWPSAPTVPSKTSTLSSASTPP